jgi:phage terminase small subunit
MIFENNTKEVRLMNPRLPVDVIEARGKTHLTKSEIERRREAELTPVDTTIAPPRWLTTKAQKSEFVSKAAQLDQLGVWDALDTDELARYVLASEAYALASKQLMKLLKTGDLAGVKLLTPIVEKHHKQCYELASSLGLNVTSRIRIAVPPKTKAKQEETDF